MSMIGFLARASGFFGIVMGDIASLVENDAP
jgi:hypothetical protein